MRAILRSGDLLVCEILEVRGHNLVCNGYFQDPSGAVSVFEKLLLPIDSIKNVLEHNQSEKLILQRLGLIQSEKKEGERRPTKGGRSPK